MNEPEHVIIDARSTLATTPSTVENTAQAIDMIRIREEALPRPEGMSRQVYRRLYRFSCRKMGIEPVGANLTDKKKARRARKQAARAIYDKQPRSARKK